ncbi:UNVERIFIED_CONTAM: hypothetical protein GTU68_025388 [Idotea baltica]|nr:hypothetical protein [Idotea baltica]
MPEGAVAPEPSTIESGAYQPLSRPLFIYVNKAALKRPEVVAYLNYYISEEGQELVSEVGYVRASAETFEKTKQILADALKEAGTTIPKKVTGEIKIDGSSTVYPVSVAVTEEFNAVQPKVKIPVAKSGTSGGMKRFYAGEIDICDASRAIKQKEIDECKKAGVEYIELKVGIDGLTVVVNAENDWCDGLTVEELKKIWEPDSQVKKWSDINPDFPDEEIALYGADSDSGTFDYFTEEICGEKGATRQDYNQSPDDNFLVTGVAGDKNAMAYFGYAYFIENKDTLKALAIAPAATAE